MTLIELVFIQGENVAAPAPDVTPVHNNTVVALPQVGTQAHV